MDTNRNTGGGDFARHGERTALHRLGDVLRQLRTVVFVLDRQDALFDANPAWSEATGLPVAASRGLPFADTVVP